MASQLDSTLAFHSQALNLRANRQQILAANIANADTPHYKARDLDFRAALQGAGASTDPPLSLATTHPSHIQPEPSQPATDALYRVPAQPSLDGNTVESEQEHVRFGENALQYQASLNFISGDFVGLRTSIRGE